MKLIITAVEIVDNLFDDIKNKINTNTHGEFMSDYHAFAEDESGECISIQLTEETNGLSPEEYFYSIHLVDNITGRDCELYFSDEFNKESVLKLVTDIIANNTYEYKNYKGLSVALLDTKTGQSKVKYEFIDNYIQAYLLNIVDTR